MRFHDDNFARRQRESDAKRERDAQLAFDKAVRKDEKKASHMVDMMNTMLPNSLDAVIHEEQEKRKRLDRIHHEMFPENYEQWE